MDQDNVKKYWDTEDVESMYDKNLLEIETGAILEHLRPHDSVIDIGCGEGEATVHYIKKVRELLALDYSVARLQKLKSQDTKAQTIQMDMRELSLGKINKRFSKAITQRSLINLVSFEDQKDVIKRIYSILKDNGIYIMLEGFIEGADALNGVRKSANLSPIDIKWHNCFISKKDLMDFISPYFKLEYSKDFSLYFFLTRVFNAALKSPEVPKWNDEINQLAKTMEIDCKNNFVKGLSRLELLIFRKI